jgi:hypothetical protein
MITLALLLMAMLGIGRGDILLQYDAASKLHTVSVEVGTPQQQMTARVTTSDIPSYLASSGCTQCQEYFGQGFNASESRTVIPGVGTINSVLIPGAQGSGQNLQDRVCLAGNSCIDDLEFLLIESFSSYWGQPQNLEYGAVLSLSPESRAKNGSLIKLLNATKSVSISIDRASKQGAITIDKDLDTNS